MLEAANWMYPIILACGGSERPVGEHLWISRIETAVTKFVMASGKQCVEGLR